MCVGREREREISLSRDYKLQQADLAAPGVCCHDTHDNLYVSIAWLHMYLHVLLTYALQCVAVCCSVLQRVQLGRRESLSGAIEDVKPDKPKSRGGCETGQAKKQRRSIESQLFRLSILLALCMYYQHTGVCIISAIKRERARFFNNDSDFCGARTCCSITGQRCCGPSLFFVAQPPAI